MSNIQLVSHMFMEEGIGLEWLEDNFNGLSPYANRGYDFINQVWNLDYWELSDPQKDWVDKILEDVTEMKIEVRKRRG
jgi:hypothetical protein